MKRLASLIPPLAMAGALTGLVAGPVLAQATPPAATSDAQTPATDAQPAGNAFGIPDDVEVFGKQDPNNRKARAVVNGQVITGTDIDQRVALVVSASQGKIADEDLDQLRMQVLRNLIDETLQIQEAKLQEVSAEPAQVEQTYARLAQQNFGQDPSKMDAYLKSIGSSPASLKRQIEGELDWRNLLSRNVAPFVNVSTEEVKDMMDRMQASRGTDQFRVGEIYLSATPETAATVEANARRIVEQLKAGGSFVGYARQYSEASTAATGGDLGYVRLATLPPEMASVVSEMQPGQLVGPVAVPGGFSILYLIDRRKILAADPRDAVLSLKQISINFPKGISQKEAEAKTVAFAKAVESIRGCGDADRAAQTVGAQVVSNDQLTVRSLPEQLQSSILQLQVGQATPPFGSLEEGVRVLLLCGRDDPEEANEPTMEEMRSQLEDDRIDKRAQRYLRDLRNDAYVEYN
nr:peptidylprolyl isomerase [Erythrobacter sp. 3-20A1M]